MSLSLFFKDLNASFIVTMAVVHPRMAETWLLVSHASHALEYPPFCFGTAVLPFDWSLYTWRLLLLSATVHSRFTSLQWSLVHCVDRGWCLRSAHRTQGRVGPSSASQWFRVSSRDFVYPRDRLVNSEPVPTFGIQSRPCLFSFGS